MSFGSLLRFDRVDLENPSMLNCEFLVGIVIIPGHAQDEGFGFITCPECKEIDRASEVWSILFLSVYGNYTGCRFRSRRDGDILRDQIGESVRKTSYGAHYFSNM